MTISSNGNVLSQQTVTPTYTSREVWGPGCGYCTQATVKVDLPHHPSRSAVRHARALTVGL